MVVDGKPRLLRPNGERADTEEEVGWSVHKGHGSFHFHLSSDDFPLFSPPCSPFSLAPYCSTGQL